MDQLLAKFRDSLLKLSLHPKVLILFRLLSIIYLISLSGNALADDVDFLEGTATSLTKTLKGTGKTYLYISEGILSVAAYIKTKNLLFLAGIVVVATFFNIMLKVAGVA